MKYFLNPLFLCLAFCLPLTTQANPTGTIIYIYPREDYSNNELWITNLENTLPPRMLFKHTDPILEIAAQETGPLIVFICGDDIFLVNRRHPDKKARDLTELRFDIIWHIDLSESGDVLFTNYHSGGVPPPKRGIYLIPNEELEQEIPKARLLKEVEATRAVWSPGGKLIAYDHEWGHGISTLNVETGEVSWVSDFGRSPIFSPDGKKLAFADQSFLEPQNIYVVSLEDPEDRKTIKPAVQSPNISKIKWTLDGRYLLYYVGNKGHFAAPVTGGPHIKMSADHHVSFNNFDWASSKGYRVEPIGHLTTLWGKLKQEPGS